MQPIQHDQEPGCDSRADESHERLQQQLVRQFAQGRELVLALGGVPSPIFALKGRKTDPEVTELDRPDDAAKVAVMETTRKISNQPEIVLTYERESCRVAFLAATDLLL